MAILRSALFALAVSVSTGCALSHPASSDDAGVRDAAHADAGTLADSRDVAPDASVIDTVEDTIGFASEASGMGEPVIDVVDESPADVPPEIVAVDIVEMPPPPPPPCGAAGEACCPASHCDSGLHCIDFGGGHSACAACGGLGEPCCPSGEACAGAATCQPFRDGVSFCVSAGAADSTAGGACGPMDLWVCQPGVSYCAGFADGSTHCVRCHDAGTLCCPVLGCSGSCNNPSSGLSYCQ